MNKHGYINILGLALSSLIKISAVMIEQLWLIVIDHINKNGYKNGWINFYSNFIDMSMIIDDNHEMTWTL